MANTWSTGGSLNTVQGNIAGCGTQSAGLSFGGGAPTTRTEEYNGTAWSTGGNLGTGRFYLAGAGTQVAGLSFGGHDGVNPSVVTEEYNGTIWGAGGNLGTARYLLGDAGIQSAGLSFGGKDPSDLVITEEYSEPPSPPLAAGAYLFGNLAEKYLSGNLM